MVALLAGWALSLSGCGGDADSASNPAASVTSMLNASNASASGASASATDAQADAEAASTSSTTLRQIASVPPPMGWSSWNSLEENVSFDTIKAEADGMSALNAKISSGAKYQYVNIDEGWWTSGQRDANGNFIVDTTQWPGGMQAIAQYVHSKGLKAGIYIDAGPQGCGTRKDGTHFVGSDFSHYDHDFLQFAQWGFDFVKVDFCGGRVAGYDPQQAYTAVSAAIDNAYVQTGQRVTLSICDWGTIGSNSTYPDFNQGPWDWGAGVGRMWRTTGDIYGPNSGVPSFGSVVGNFNGNYHPQGQHTGYYNDPDMMVAGMGMSSVHDQSHVGLWAIAGAPLILGNDLSKPLTDDAIRLLTNPEVIAIDQDPLGTQGLKVAQSGGQQVWAKLLSGAGQRAVLLFNNSAADGPMTFSFAQLGLVPGARTAVRDVWARKDLGTATAAYTVPNVPAGGVVLLRLSGRDVAPSMFLPTSLAGGASWARCPECVGGRKVKNLGVANYANVVSRTTGGFVEIAYLNRRSDTLKVQLVANGGTPTTLAFPPTGRGGRVGTVTVYVDLQPGKNTLAFSSIDSAAPTPELSSLAVVAGPVRLLPFKAAYEAEAPGNTLAGGARVSACSGCSGGQDVGYIGNGGTLTINGIAAAADGAYTVQIGYANGDSADRVAQISFDGAAPVTVSFPPTGGWSTTSTLTVSGTFKAGGANTLMFSNPSGWAPDIDGIGAPATQ
ncbi:carbohydrate-binding protein [Burkholderia alba]|uniref:carbohydrate-binding protein n=1 Tax=Burkholderia alba TaxID=2683677 RepID=UPI002B060EE8|nr:carbohydrate-binding protein [Burkholderia alba]